MKVEEQPDNFTQVNGLLSIFLDKVLTKILIKNIKVRKMK